MRLHHSTPPPYSHATLHTHHAPPSQLRHAHALVLQSEVQARVLQRFNAKLEAEVVWMQASEKEKRAALQVLHQEAVQGGGDGEEREMERVHKEVCVDGKRKKTMVLFAITPTAAHFGSWWPTAGRSLRCRRPRRRRTGCVYRECLLLLRMNVGLLMRGGCCLRRAFVVAPQETEVKRRELEELKAKTGEMARRLQVCV